MTAMLRPIVTSLFLVGSCLAFIIATDIGDVLSWSELWGQTFGVFLPHLPFLLFGSVTSALIARSITPTVVQYWLPEHRPQAIVGALFFGILFPVGEYGVIPVIRQLIKKGLPVYIGIVCLLSAPILNPIAIASNYIQFGFGAILLGQLLLTVVISMAIGFIFTLQPDSVNALVHSISQSDDTTRYNRGITIVVTEFIEFSLYLFLGSVLVVFFNNILVELGTVDIITGSDASAVGLVELLGVTTAYLSAVDAPVLEGLSLGSVLAITVSGVMVDIRTTILLLSIFKLRVTSYIVVLVSLLILLLSIWVTLVI